MSPLVITREGVISFGRMSLSLTPLGRACSWCGVLMPSSLVARFLEGDEGGSWSSGLRFLREAGSLAGMETAWGSSRVRSSHRHQKQ